MSRHFPYNMSSDISQSSEPSYSTDSDPDVDGKAYCCLCGAPFFRNIVRGYTRTLTMTPLTIHRTYHGRLQAVGLIFK